MEAKTFAERLSQRMKELGIRQKDIIKATGKSSGAVSSWVKGAYVPKGDALKEIAKLLNTTADWLLEGKGPKEASEAAKVVTLEVMPVITWEKEGDFKQKAMLLLKEAGYTVETDNLPKIEVSWNRFIIPTFRVIDTKSGKTALVQIYREWKLLGIPLRRIRNTKDFVFVSTDEVERIVDIVSEHFTSPPEQKKTLSDLIAAHLSFSLIYKALKTKTDKLPPAARRAVAEMLSEAITSDKDTDTPRYIEKLLEEADREDTDEPVSDSRH